MKEQEGICIGTVKSVCPVCLRVLTAKKIRIGDAVYLEKECEEHGYVRTLIWRGSPDYESWGRAQDRVHPINPSHAVTEKGCPYDCGLCAEHRQRTCCVLMEVTQRCNLKCPVCFASAGKERREPSIEQIENWFEEMLDCGGPFNIQLSGGEPTMRDDLGTIIRLGKEKGFSFFQLNTNGLRIAREAGYIEQLAEAGLDCVFLQFDGLRSETCLRLRGRDLSEEKQQAIEACRRAGVGVVLVPTLASGVNTDEVGEILRFALEQMPAVRGVHFQPMSYFGRYDKMDPEQRYTLPDLLRDIEEQTGGMMKASDFTGGNAENAYCSFSGSFMKQADGSVHAVRTEKNCCCGSEKIKPEERSRKAQKFVARRWSGKQPAAVMAVTQKGAAGSGCCRTGALDEFLDRLRNYTLSVSCMTFMDAWNLDLERLQQCYINIISQKERLHLVPFCAYNLTSLSGEALYRGKECSDT